MGNQTTMTDWLEVRVQKDNWTRAMMSASSLTAWKSRSVVKNKLAAKNPGKQTEK